MHRAADGSIVVYDAGHMDTYDAEAGAMAPAVAFRSHDNGLTRETADPAQCAHPGRVFRLADGARVQFVPKGPPANLQALRVARCCG